MRAGAGGPAGPGAGVLLFFLGMKAGELLWVL